MLIVSSSPRLVAGFFMKRGLTLLLMSCLGRCGPLDTSKNQRPYRRSEEGTAVESVFDQE